MNCPNCNTIVDENDNICINCGSSLRPINNPGEINNQPTASAPSAPSIPKNNGMAIASMVLGIVAIPLICCRLVGIVPAILAIVFGFLSKKKIAESNGLEIGKGMSLAGIILGFVTVGICAIIIVISIIGMFGLTALSENPEFFEEFLRRFEEGMRQ